MRTTVMRGGFTGGVAGFTGSRLATSGECTTGTIATMLRMRELGSLPGNPLGTAPTTPLGAPGPLGSASGGSIIMTATGGTLTGAIRAWVETGVDAPWCGNGSTRGPGGGGAGGAPGATSPVTKNARPKVCGETSGANIKQPISAACPVNPMAVVQTLLEDGS